MVKLQTTVKLPQYPVKLAYNKKYLLLGSCFSDNIGQKLKAFKFNAIHNPMGVLYNPLSINQALEILLTEREYTENDLFFANNLWNSYAHHSSFSDASKANTLKKINSQVHNASKQLKQCHVLFLTWGTSMAYFLKDNDQLVANCHKQGTSSFNHRLLTVTEMFEDYTSLIEKLTKINPGIQLVFTISPIRHWKDGAFGNQVSKAGLFLLLHNLLNKFDNCHYFPAYEIFIDELRDYRFYANDMLHPSEVGINYVWERFTSAFIEKAEQDIMHKVDKINKAFNHKPFNQNTPNHQQFIKSTIEGMQSLMQQHSFLDYSNELKVLSARLN